MEIRLVRHNRNGLGYAVKYEDKAGLIKVRFLDKMENHHFSFSIQRTKDTFKDLGVIDDTEKNELFS